MGSMTPGFVALKLSKALRGVKEAQSLIQAFNMTEEYFSNLYYTLKDIDNKQYIKLEKLRRKNSKSIQEVSFARIWKTPENTFYIQNLLHKKLKEALALVPEFGEYSGFSEALTVAFSNPEMIQVFLNKGNQPVVKILADEYAGTVEELSSLISVARSSFKESVAGEIDRPGKGALSGWKATLIWYIKMYRSARTGKTYWQWRKDSKGNRKKEPRPELTKKYAEWYKRYMDYRIAQFGIKAPIWHLLENGNFYLPKLKSDKKAFGDPDFPATHFVKTTEELATEHMRILYKDSYMTVRGEQEKACDVIIKNLNKLDTTLDFLAQLMEMFDEELASFSPPLEVEGSGSGVGGLENYTNDFFRDLEVDSKKILKEVEKISEELENNEDLLQKSLLKEKILLERLLLGEVPESGRMYFISAGGKEIRINVKNALIELNSIINDKDLINSLKAMDREALKAELVRDQLRYKTLVIMQRKRNK